MRKVAAVPRKEWPLVCKEYREGASMQHIANSRAVSLDAITYILRKSGVQRRTKKEANKLSFLARPPSFTLKRASSDRTELDLVGAMLYWAEGYKRDTASGIDFANSDPDMAELFWRFMCDRYEMDMQRLYLSVYHYADQDLRQITAFWSKKLNISTHYFKHSYKKSNPRLDARKLPYGVLHIRYNDKKMLWDVLNLIKSCKVGFCVGGGVVKRN